VEEVETSIPAVKDIIAKLKSKSVSAIFSAIEEVVSLQKEFFAENSDCKQTAAEGQVWFDQVEEAFVDSARRNQGFRNIL